MLSLAVYMDALVTYNLQQAAIFREYAYAYRMGGEVLGEKMERNPLRSRAFRNMARVAEQEATKNRGTPKDAPEPI